MDKRVKILTQAFEYANEDVLETTDCLEVERISMAGVTSGLEQSRERQASSKSVSATDIGSIMSTKSLSTPTLQNTGLLRPSKPYPWGNAELI